MKGKIMKHQLYKPHPWHGINSWADKESLILNVFVEMVPTDSVKYELDKVTGYLKVDRPQVSSNLIPSLYGFIPQTYCDEHVANYTNKILKRENLNGDKDPLDICVLTEKDIQHGDILLEAIPIGGLRMIDNGEVDDKIIAVLKDDAVYGKMNDIKDCPEKVIDRLKHYFLTYKQIPGESPHIKCEITHIYGQPEALQIINLTKRDYRDNFHLGDPLSNELSYL
jgi:inorganic pyrophosphatase